MFEIGTTVRLFVRPLLNNVEHLGVKVAMWVAICGMMEDTRDIVEDLVEWNVGVFPSEQNTRRDVLEDSRSNLTCWLVEDIAEMIF